MEPNSEGGAEDYLLEPPISDVEIWLEWQASRLSTPTWWLELRAIPGVKDMQKLTCKIWASFSIPEARMRAILGQGFTVPPAPKCLDRNAFLLDDLSYQDVPVLLTITYARGLQYWAEKRNPPESPASCPLVGGVVELREAVREYITPTRMFSRAWGQFTQELQTSSPKAPCLAKYCCHWATNPVDLILVLWKLPPKPLPWLLPMWNGQMYHPTSWNGKGKTIICWSLLPL